MRVLSHSKILPLLLPLPPLDELMSGVDYSIKVLICRSWEAKSPSGKYIGTEYVVSDDKGNLIHVITRSSIAHCVVPKLNVGEVYHIRRFAVAPSKEIFRIRKDDAFLIYLEGYFVIHKLDCPTAGFKQHPFEITSIGKITFNKKKYLIDVVGRVSNLGLSYQGQLMGCDFC